MCNACLARAECLTWAVCHRGSRLCVADQGNGNGQNVAHSFLTVQAQAQSSVDSQNSYGAVSMHQFGYSQDTRREYSQDTKTEYSQDTRRVRRMRTENGMRCGDFKSKKEKEKKKKKTKSFVSAIREGGDGGGGAEREILQ